MTVDEIRQKLEEHDELKTRLRTKSYDEHQRILDEVYKVRDDLSVNECRVLLERIAGLEADNQRLRDWLTSEGYEVDAG